MSHDHSRESSGRPSPHAEITELRDLLAPLLDETFDVAALDKVTRDWARGRRRRNARVVIILMGVTAAVALAWQAPARRSQVQVSGTAFVDAVLIRTGDHVLVEDSWESAAVSAPTSEAPSARPTVTNARAAAGSKSLIITASTRENPKVRWPVTAQELTGGKLTYEASVYLDEVGPAGLILGLVTPGDPAPDYDQAAVVFSNGRCRIWPVERSFATYEPRRWYRVRVDVRLADRSMDVSIDGTLHVQGVPYGDPTGMTVDHPEWSEVDLWEGFAAFAVGGVYDGSILADSGEPLAALPRGAHQWSVSLDGTVSGWRPTGIQLQTGDRLVISADPEDAIRYAGKQASARTNPDGYLLQAPDPRAARFIQAGRFPTPAPTAWFGSLVARIGSRQGFFAGSDLVMTVADAGQLFLAYNDNTTSDNAGSFAITIRVDQGQ